MRMRLSVTWRFLFLKRLRRRWSQTILHMNRAGHLRKQLLKFGGLRLTVVTVPWRLSREEG
ncbi:hypothetical protein AOG23_29800 [Rhizobium acidisoli]|nr:hypothetical protein AOG23_29800 [Rhizobium acidisoli]